MENTSVQADCWMKLGEAAFALGVSEITMRRKVKGGKLQHEFKEGKYWVLLKRDVATGHFSEPGHHIPLIHGLQGQRETIDLTRKAENDAKVRELEEAVDEKEEELRKLRRMVEDQQTLIILLEQSLGSSSEAP